MISRACSISNHRRSLALTPEKISNSTDLICRIRSTICAQSRRENHNRLHAGNHLVVFLAAALPTTFVNTLLRITVGVVGSGRSQTTDTNSNELFRILHCLHMEPAVVLTKGFETPYEESGRGTEVWSSAKS